MKLIKKNIKSLIRTNPILAERVKDCFSKADEWEMCPAENGQITAKHRLKNGLFRYIHSRINPEREAERWAAVDATEFKNIVILGFGLGYHVHALQRRNTFSQMIIVEADLELFQLALKSVDLAPILQDQRIHLSIGEKPSAFKGCLYNLFPDVTSYRLFLPSIDLNPEYYQSIRGILEDYIHVCRLKKDPLLSQGVMELLDATVKYG